MVGVPVRGWWAYVDVFHNQVGDTHTIVTSNQILFAGSVLYLLTLLLLCTG